MSFSPINHGPAGPGAASPDDPGTGPANREPVPQLAVYLFDIDGTLLDSAEDICGAVQDVLGMTDCPPVTFERLKGYIGLHLYDMFEDLIPGIAAERMQELIQHYRRFYHARENGRTRIYPGVAEALAALGGRKSTATTKGSPYLRVVLEQFGLLRHFDHVQGTDGFPAKPAPDVIHAALAALQARPEDCLMVGDSPADMEAGRRAGEPARFVTVTGRRMRWRGSTRIFGSTIYVRLRHSRRYPHTPAWPGDSPSPAC